jgi:hypothetical protein
LITQERTTLPQGEGKIPPQIQRETGIFSNQELGIIGQNAQSGLNLSSRRNDDDIN